MVSQKEWLRFRRNFLKGKKNFQGRYTCESCGLEVEHIEVDHIKRRGSHPELALDPNNLQLLCSTCHYKKDSGFR